MIDLKKDLTDILSELIRIPSTTNHEDEILDAIRKAANNYNVVKEYDDGKNILLSLEASSESRQTILLAGHVDTVPPSTPEQLNPKIIKEGGQSKLYGRGSVDMKAGISAILKSLDELVDKKIKHNIKFLFYSGEEGPLPNGLTKVIESGILNDVSICIIPEPTSSKLAISCMGTVTVDVKVEGKSSHSAWPKEGINAIYKASELIKKISDYGSKKVSFNGLDCYETINVTRIRTENAHNVIPNSCLLTINYRFSPTKSLDEAMQYLSEIISGYEFNIIDKSPSCLASLDSNLLNTSGLEKIVFQAWSDIAQLNEKGILAINFGPGDIRLAHRENEHIEIDELKRYYKKLIDMIT